MFIVIYQFTVKVGCNVAFTEAWRKTTVGTALFKGGLGSRLHRETSGDYIAYAQWPDERTYRHAMDIVMPEEFESHREIMLRCLHLDKMRVLHEMELELDCLQAFDVSQPGKR